MKKYFLISILCLLSLVSIAQTSTLPSKFGIFQAFRNNPITFTLNFPTGYVFPTTTAETWDGETNTSQKVSTTPSVNISSNVLTVGYTAAQIRTLSSLGRFVTYIVFTDTANVKKYVLAANITVSSTSGAPSSNIINVSVPEIGNVSVNLLGETGLTSNYVTLAQNAANTATTSSTNSQTQASISIAKATEATNAATSATNTVKFRQPYGLSTYLRAQPDTTYKSFYITDKGREGVFVYNSTSSAADDSSMVIISGGRRYVRVATSVRPEYFGADPTDMLDDYIPIQKALNTATSKGLLLELSDGTYYTSNTLKPKKVGNGAQYRIRIKGNGRNRTIIRGITGISGKTLLEFANSSVGGTRLDTGIDIIDVDFQGSGADKLIYANYMTGFQLINCQFIGGETCGVQIGDGIVENFGVYIKDCYFNGNTLNSSQNKALLRLWFTRYATVEEMVGDGGNVAIDLFQSDNNSITRCHTEGAKTAEFHIRGSGGGNHKITDNLIGTYGFFDPAGNFAGTQSGILVEGTSGGCSQISFIGNKIITPNTNQLGTVAKITSPTGTLTPSSTTFTVTGGTSGATGKLIGYNVDSARVIIDNVVGTFVTGETVTQATTGGTFVINSFITKATYGIQFLGSAGYHTVVGNHFIGSADYAIKSVSDGNTISNNNISGTTGKGGILFSNNITITGNRIYTPSGVSVMSTGGSYIYGLNFITGSLSGVTP